MNETSSSIVEAEARTLATKIKTEFSTAGGYRWRRGKLFITYRRPDQGWNLKLYAFSETEAREVINKVLDLRSQNLDSEYLSIHESKADFPANPGNQMVYGKSRPKPVRRPVTYVRYQRSTLSMHGLTKGITLHDRTGYQKGLVSP